MVKEQDRKNRKRNIAMQTHESRMKVAWEGGRWVCVPLFQERKERREGKEGREGGGVVRANETRSGSERGQQSGST